MILLTSLKNEISINTQPISIMRIDKTIVFEHSTPEVIESAIAQLGSYQALIAVTMLQTLIYSLFGWVVGYFIVDRLGLIKPFRFEKAVLAKVCPVIVILGLAFAADYFVMGRLIPVIVFLLNGSFALFFGRWFRKYGIQYAMLGHFGIHFISKIILICVL